MSFFRMPKLDANGKLSQEDALSIYCSYLTTEKNDFENKLVRPIRSSIYKGMCEIHAKQKLKSETIIQDQIDKGGRLLFWSDQHFNHTNIIKFSNRPYNSVEHMNISMLNNYYNKVRSDDVVIFGGDISFGDINAAKLMLNSLIGNKVLILGNHEFHKNNEYRNYNIFNATTMCCVLYKKIDNKICNIIVTHYPIDNKFLPPNTINIHGHIHTQLADKKNINMSVEHLDYTPQDLSEKIINVFSTMEKI